MRVLLDTHTFLWGLTEAEKLSAVARRTIASETFLSAASIWEVLIKVQVRKLRLPSPAGEYLTAKMRANGVSALPIKLEHGLRIESLKMHHRDRFDRMLIAQSIEEGWPMITADPVFKKYRAQVIWSISSPRYTRQTALMSFPKSIRVNPRKSGKEVLQARS
jgi:PIN domain nuclease of toxin-antitoxin system